MKEAQFYWGTFARACYIAAWWFCPLFGFTNPTVLFYYIPLLIFVGVGLRPLLEATGLYYLFQAILLKRDDMNWEKRNADRRAQVKSKVRRESLKQRRAKDPRLPKNW